MKIHQSFQSATRLPLKAVQIHKFEVIAKEAVDDQTWYTIQVEPAVSKWLIEQSADLWYDHKVGKFRVLDTYDIHESLYTLMALRWG